MEGSHQKHNNWYRCQYVTRRGVVAADVSGHPRVLGVKEDVILEATLDFLGRRIFGPNRLRLLRAEMANATTASWKDHDAELERLQRERADVEQSLYRQALRLEEHEDPNHPIVKLAGRRIEELAARQSAIEDAIATLQAARPQGSHPDQVAAMLEAIPDMRDVPREASESELMRVFDAFNVTATYTSQPAVSNSPRLSPQSSLPPTKNATALGDGRGTLA
jgi:hypothetical protein